MMRSMGDTMKIHLSKPGGQNEGPYTLEQILQDLAANKYRDTDYWAWHEGLTEWVPLYALPGIAADDDAAPPDEIQAASPAGSAVQPGIPPAAPVTEPGQESAVVRNQVSSGLPASALDQIFVFTTGDGPSAWRSPMVARMLKEIIGDDVSALREGVPRDVVARCAVGELLKPDGSISDAVWRAMDAHRPVIVQDARARLYRVCVRTFRVEADVLVVLVLFSNKQKLPAAIPGPA
jgi:hypothetical protein